VKNGPNDFTLLVASAQTQPSATHNIEGTQEATATLKVQYGDFSQELAKVVAALNEVFCHFSPRWVSFIKLLP
jgi:dipeptidyl-peptidase-3